MLKNKKLELKAVKVYNSMSEETTCFEASLYLDGKKLGKVMNRGNGGDHEYHFDASQQKLLDDYAKAQPMYQWSDGTEFVTIEDGKSTTSEWSHQDAEMVVSNLLEQYLNEKDLAKELNKGVMLMEKETDNLSSYMMYSYKKYPQLKRNPLDLKNAKWFGDNHVIINCLSPKDKMKYWTRGQTEDLYRYKVLKEQD